MSSALIDFLVTSKEACNNKCRREAAIRDGTVEQYEQQYSKTSFEYDSKCYSLLKDMEKEYNKYESSIKHRRYSEDFDGTHGDEDDSKELKINTEDESVAELRKRLLGRLSDKAEQDAGQSVETQIQNHEDMQQNLYEDMSKLVGSLKQGAVAFQNALEEDQKVLGAAEIGIQVASRGIVYISGKLKTYDKAKLGYLFYILTFLFMFIGLCVTFIIIKIFPAM